MSRVWMRYVVSGIILLPIIGVSHAQSTTPHGNWMMQNYHFTGPLAPREVKPIDAALVELRQIQSTVRTILGRATFDGDYEAALAAAAQALANAQLIGTITEHLQAPQNPQPAKSTIAEAQSPSPVFLIALKDKVINAATSYWVDGPMLNYVTVQGVHMIVRLDLVDHSLSRDVNRQRNVEFRLPE